MNYYLEIPILYIYSNVPFIWVLTSSIPIVSQAALKLNISRIDLYFVKKIAVETWLDLITEAISTLRHPLKNITLKGVWKKITHLRKLALMSSSKDQQESTYNWTNLDLLTLLWKRTRTVGTVHNWVRWEISFNRIWAHMLGGLGECLRKYDLALNWMLSGSGGNFKFGHFNESSLGEKDGARLLQLVKK